MEKALEVLTLTPEEFLYRQTEEYALKREQEEIDWNEKYELEEEKLINQVNSLLGEHSPKAWDALLAMFHDPKLNDIYGKREQIATVYVLLNIYQYERYEEISPTIFEQGTHLGQFNDLMREMKFLLWRLSFFDIEHSTKSGYGNIEAQEREFFDYVEARGLSPVALYFLVTVACVEPTKMLLYLADKYMEQNKFYHTMMILKYYDANYPGNRDVEYVLSEMGRIL